MRSGDETGVRRKSGETTAGTGSVAEEVPIPDYVMLDFVDDMTLPGKRYGGERGAEPGISPDPFV